MAKIRKKIKPSVKKQIIDESGNKCANPGCCNWRVHIHHIKHWSIYQSNDLAILIAVCPSCHDAIHHGAIEFSDELLYSWKGIERQKRPNTTHVYIEPSDEIKLLTGSISLSTQRSGLKVFELSPNNKLSFRILDQDIALLNLNICDLNGKNKLKVVDNHVRIYDTDMLKFEQVPGHIRVISKEISMFFPEKFIERMRMRKPDFAVKPELLLLELLVIKPGLIKVCGCWADHEKAVVITEDSMSFLRDRLEEPFTLVGRGESSELLFSSKVDCSLFNF